MTEDELAIVAYEAFMTGRVYAKGGERESPAEIHDTLMRNVRAALAKMLVDQSDAAEAEYERLALRRAIKDIQKR